MEGCESGPLVTGSQKSGMPHNKGKIKSIIISINYWSLALIFYLSKGLYGSGPPPQKKVALCHVRRASLRGPEHKLQQKGFEAIPIRDDRSCLGRALGAPFSRVHGPRPHTTYIHTTSCGKPNGAWGYCRVFDRETLRCTGNDWRRASETKTEI